MRSTFATLLLILAPTAATAGAPTPAELVKRLASEDFAERAEAGRALEQLGAKAVPDLLPALDHPDAEVRRRVQTMLRQIEERQLRDEVLKPRTVRFKFKDVRLSKVLEDIQAETGLRVTLANDIDPTVRLTVDTGELPFWQAWERVGRAAGLTEENVVLVQPAREALFLAPAEDHPNPAGPACVTGLLRVAVRDPNWGGSRILAGVTNVLEVWADPHLDLFAVDGVHITAAIDDGNRPLDLVKSVAYPRAAPAQARLVDLDTGRIVVRKLGVLTPLRLPAPAKGNVLREVRGDVTARFLVRRPAVTVPSLAAAVGKTCRGSGGVKLDVQSVTSGSDGSLAVRCRLANLDALADPDLGIPTKKTRNGVVIFADPVAALLRQIELRDKGGKALPRLEIEREADSKEGVTCRLVFATRAKAEELSLVVTGQHLVRIEVPFVLKNVKLAD